LLVQLSDLHVTVGPGDDRAARRLEAAVAAVANLDPAPAAVLISGDLVEVPSPAAYERVRELLAPLPAPVHALPGNHDDRDELRAAFGPAGDAHPAGSPVRVIATCGALRLVGCDTILPGRDDGRLDDDELAWLDAALAEARDTPTVVAMHHPPVLTGIRVVDEIGLPEADRVGLARVLERHPHVRLVTCGHSHRTMTGTIAGRPLLVCPSTDLQLRLDLQPDSPRGIELTDEPPGFAVHVLLGDGLRSYVEPVTPPG
jgi:3',5'-cyclic AMP phosphodiesterase CpdA